MLLDSTMVWRDFLIDSGSRVQDLSGPECVRQKEKVLFLCVQVELDSGIWPLSLHCYKSESRTSLWVCCPIAACWPMTTVSGPWPSVQPPGKVNTVLLLWLAVGLGDNIWFNIQVTVEVSGFFYKKAVKNTEIPIKQLEYQWQDTMRTTRGSPSTTLWYIWCVNHSLRTTDFSEGV